MLREVVPGLQWGEGFPVTAQADELDVALAAAVGHTLDDRVET